MIAVGPDPPGLDRAAEPVGGVAAPGPDARAKTVGGVIGKCDRLLDRLERGDRQDGTEDLLLEDAHVVLTHEHGRLHEIALVERTARQRPGATDQTLRALGLADIDIAQDLVELVLRRLRADLDRRVERIALADRGDARHGALDEAVEDRLMDQGARRAGTDLALVEGEQSKAFERLVEEGIVLVEHVRHEDVGRLAAKLHRLGDQMVRRGVHDLLAGDGLAGERDLGDARIGGDRLADGPSRAGDDIEHAGRQDVGGELGEHQQGERRLGCGLDDGAVARRQRRGDLPRRHQQREVPRDDLADDAERLAEMIGDGVGIDRRDAAFLRPDAAGEVAEMVDCKRHVGSAGLADRLAIVDRLGKRQQLQIILEPVGDAIENPGALGGRDPCPLILGGVRRIERALDIFRRRQRELGDLGAIDRALVGEILAARRSAPAASDEIIIAVSEGGRRVNGPDRLLEHNLTPSLSMA